MYRFLKVSIYIVICYTILIRIQMNFSNYFFFFYISDPFSETQVQQLSDNNVSVDC